MIRRFRNITSISRSEEASMKNLQELRDSMIKHHLKARGVENPAVLRAMQKVPREAFLPENLAKFAYEDSPLPIDQGQTISQPYGKGILPAFFPYQSFFHVAVRCVAESQDLIDVNDQFSFGLGQRPDLVLERSHTTNSALDESVIRSQGTKFA
jgi:hypothetical protein